MKKILFIGLGLIVLVGVCFLLMFPSRLVSAGTLKFAGYDLWEKVLEEYVNDEGRVDYEELLKNRVDLDAFIDEIFAADLDQFNDDQRKAFWINAYNALTLQLIIDRYPLKFGGIRTINLGRPWSIKRKVAGRELTLREIEHDILRKWKPSDPRVHFALNCASIGCPNLPREPFYPDRLEKQLDYETRRFMNNPQKVRLDRENNILYHSELFNWYEDDFLIEAKDKLTYIKRYLNEDDRKYLDAHEVSLKRIKYDWGLNKQ